MTFDDACDELKEVAAADMRPCLSETAIARLVKKWRRYQVWEPNKTVRVVDSYAPTDNYFNGRLYRPETVGTTGDTEPTWGVTTTGQTVLDGTVTWIDVGTAPMAAYDLAGAAHDAWTEKAAKAAQLCATSYGDEKEQADQIFAHCQDMVSSFAPVYIV